MRYLAWIAVVFSLIPIPSLAAPNEVSKQNLIKHLIAEGLESPKFVSGQVRPMPARFDFPPLISYRRLERRYREALTECARAFPSGVINSITTPHLSAYSGRLEIEEPETLGSPCMLVSLRAFDSRTAKYFSLKIEFKGKTFYGLRVQGKVRPLYLRLPVSALAALYIPDINARSAGFQYAQLILELSKNTKTADRFNYNGIREWSDHQRYRESDQVQRPIALNNFAHQVGSRYVLSPHPDFSLRLLNYKSERVLLTFFLWGKEVAGEIAPDFIFQIDLRP